VKTEQELPERVYRIDPQSGAVTIVAEGIEGPNGLAFSPDESRLYIVQSRGVDFGFNVGLEPNPSPN
jgi:gluconolactonase